MGIDDIKASFRRRRVEARVLFDGSLIDEHARLEAALQRAIRDDAWENRPPDAPGLVDAVRALEERIETEQKTFVFEGIGDYAWFQLVAHHPPSREDRASGYDFDTETFAPQAVAASCVEPSLTVDDARWLFVNLDVAEWQRLWGACLLANLGERDRPKSLTATAAAVMRNTSLTTVPLEESPGQSS